MERLTIRDQEGKAHATRVGYYDIIDKLAAYEEAEEKGLLLRLPCKVGDEVYIVGDRFPAVVEAIRIGEDNHVMIEFVEYDKSHEITEVWDEGGFELEDFGKTVFFTQAEAERKWAELQKE